MLLSLSIKNYALIEELRLEFGPGFTVFTGETGAGKSIIIESIGLLLGGRASAQAVRKGSQRCFISGEFDAGKLNELAGHLAASGLSDDGESTIIVRREIDAQGKSRAFVNDRPVTVAALETIGAYLIDVHGQNDHQSLLRPAAQRAILDRFGQTETLRADVAGKHRQWRELVAKLEAKQLSEQERERLIDLYSFQVTEIDNARLQPGEEEEIEAQLPQLKNAERLAGLSDEAYQVLYGSDGAATEMIGKALRAFENIIAITGSLAETAESLKAAASQVEDAAREVESFRDNLTADPEKLNTALERQDLISKLKKKYGSTIADILAYRDETARQLNSISGSERDRKELEAAAAKALESLTHACAKLTAARKKSAEKLGAGVEKELADLGMKKARFQASLEKLDTPTADGIDKMEFLFSANPGEDIKPLKDIASGGEMSRVMLALKTVLAKADTVPVLIFDEIDAGIGGPMGQVVGRKMSALARLRQVLCISHLPQIAAQADRHYHVAKHTAAGRTSTVVTELADTRRVEEIARMLSGDEVTQTARTHAAELIESSK